MAIPILPTRKDAIAVSWRRPAWLAHTKSSYRFEKDVLLILIYWALVGRSEEIPPVERFFCLDSDSLYDVVCSSVTRDDCLS